MKISFLFGCLFLAGGLWAAPWGAMVDYDLPSVSSNERNLAVNPSSSPGERYLLRKVLSGQAVKVLLSEENGSPETYAAFQNKIQEAYNSWFLNTAKAIRSAKRAQEFADILPMLERGIAVEFVLEGEDISVKFVDRSVIPQVCSKDARACYVFGGGEIPVIYVPKNPKGSRANPFLLSSGKILFASLVHEIGHSLGFSDQYAVARDGSSHPVYRGQNPSKTIMNSHTYSLSCDDADGVINLIDITRQTRRGGQRGWRSLCKKSKAYYVGGSQFGVGPYGIFINKDETAWLLQKYNEGVFAGSTAFAIDYNAALSPFFPIEEKVSRRDLLGRPLEASGPRGERIYYMHLYDASVRLVTKDGKALLLERTSRYVEKGKLVTEGVVFFGKDGRFAKIYALKGRGRGEITYTEGEGADFVSVKMWFNKKGPSDGFWSGAAVDNPTMQFHNSPEQPGLAGRVSKRVEKRYSLQQKERLEERLAEWYRRLPLK